MFPLRITHNPPLSQCSCLVLTAGGAAVLFTCVCVCVCTRVCVCVCTLVQSESSVTDISDVRVRGSFYQTEYETFNIP